MSILWEKTVRSREGYSFVVSRSSRRISKYEYMSGENLKPWFQGDGAFYLYQSGNNQTESYGVNYIATVDSYHLPGTNNYSGGTTLDTYGTSAMQLGDDNAYAAKQLGLLPDDFVVYKNCNANKSWFMFEDEIVVVGSNIIDDLKRGVTTTLDNPMSLESENVVLEGKSKDSNDISILENGKYNNLDWISYSTDSHNSNIGYYFQNSKEININNELRTANLRDIRQANSDKEVTTQFTTLTYNHSSGEEKDSYAYVILPNFDKEMTSNYAENPKINILVNSESVHALEQTDLNITGYNFFDNEERTVGNITSFNQAS
ncbi:polysaccharide lyase family 8 super-sandwich domain-containing protein [Clostridium gallinarum]